MVAISIKGETAWLNVKHDIELKIINGDFSAGGRVPPIRKVASDYNISIATAAKVLENLNRDGTLYKKRGVGYFVEPYIKEKLCTEHKKNLERILIYAFDYAKLIGVDLMVVISQMHKVKDKKI